MYNFFLPICRLDLTSTPNTIFLVSRGLRAQFSTEYRQHQITFNVLTRNIQTYLIIHFLPQQR